MSEDAAPILDPRDTAQIAADLLERLPAYAPGWAVAERGPSQAIIQAFARYQRALAERINQAPEKHKLAFLDMLGAGLLPPQAARTPLVFEPLPSVGDSRLPAGTRAGAQIPGASAPLIFETEGVIGLTAARLAEVVSVWPGRDAYADHSADSMAGRPFRLFTPLQPIQHALYLGHRRHFNLQDDATVTLLFELARPADAPLALSWECWDGEGWRGFEAVADGTSGLTRSGSVRLSAQQITTAATTVAGHESFWLRARLRAPLPATGLPTLARVTIGAELAQAWDLGEGLVKLDRENNQNEMKVLLDKKAARLLIPAAALVNGQAVDPSGAYQLFGSFPRLGDSLALASPAFGLPGADVVLVIRHSQGIQEREFMDQHVDVEHWDGMRWRNLLTLGDGHDIFPFIIDGVEAIQFSVPADIAPTTLAGRRGFWIRLRISAGVYGRRRPVTPTYEMIEPLPPQALLTGLAYRWQGPQASPEHCLSVNDFMWREHSDDARFRGPGFAPFIPGTDRTPTLYLGFDRALPADLISLLLDMAEPADDAQGPRLRWEGWDGAAWADLAAADETAGLALPGLVAAVWPVAPPPAGSADPGPMLARFGTPRAWLRARMAADGEPPMAQIQAIYPNAVWATQAQSFADEVLGAGSGQPGQTLFLRNTPVLPGEVIEVRELDGPRAAIELPMLREELLKSGLGDGDLRLVYDPRGGQLREVWVRWQPRAQLLGSTSHDRHYVLEHSRGRVIFARSLPPGADSVLARSYRAGGGSAGNVPPGSVSQLLSGVSARGVRNPRPAAGGADGEPLSAASRRAPQALVHYRQAVSAADYEALAREASPEVALARALPNRRPGGIPALSSLTLVIVPKSAALQPQPSLELRRGVRDFLAPRVSTALVGRIAVVGPEYLPVGVATTITPYDPGSAGQARADAMAALQRFLHPLIGGPRGEGWPFGRDIYLSDVAAMLSRIPTVDAVVELALLLDDAPVGEVLPVPPDRIVTAGALQVRLRADEG